MAAVVAGAPAAEAAGAILNVNVGVMGHVDSGKTSLVRALSTELSTAALDKHPQSQERGITLDLGFSAFTTEMPPHLAGSSRYGSLQFTFVDCPGHAALIKTIIGGAQIIDMMILVIDITKGIQTQTAECLVVGEITTDDMIVVLNKVDLLPEDGREKRIEAISARIRKVLASTKFAEAPFVVLSAAPGGAGKLGAAAPSEDERGGHKSQAASVKDLVDVMKKRVRLPSRDASGPFLFAVDHCFPIKGQGTVLTGTVLAGSAKVNDTVELPALRQERKIKSIQMFKKPVSSIQQGDRAGICVTGLDASLVERGLLCTPNTGAIALVKRIRFFKGNSASESKFHITVGHTTVMATVVFFGARELAKSDVKARAAAEADAAASAIVEEFTASTDAAAATTVAGASAGKPVGRSPPAGAAGAHTGPRVRPYDFAAEYEWQDELMGGRPTRKADADAASAAPSAAAAGAKAPSAAAGAAASADDEIVYEWQWAALLFDAPVLCPSGAMVIGSHLDTDIHANACRLAFYGRVSAPLESSDVHALQKLHLYKRKCKSGVVDRIEEGSPDGSSPVTVVGRNLFKKETDMSLFVGLTVHTRYGQRGNIDAAFGKSGKFKATFLSPKSVHVPTLLLNAQDDVKAADFLASLGTVSQAAEYIAVGSAPPVKAGEPLLLRFRKYLYEKKEEGKSRKIRQ